MKTHLNFSTNDLTKSVAFYSTLLDAQPSKVLSDYALFITDRPELELALGLSSDVVPSHDAHYGIFVETPESVERAAERLRSAGLAASVEREEACCYAIQTKVWTADPEGRRWEVYTVHADSDETSEVTPACCA